MSKIIRHKLQDLRFVGGRFENNSGWLDFDILPELLVYKKLVVETAKRTWRRKNPGRERLPGGFEENIHLAFHEVLEGSSIVPVERVIEVEDDMLEMYQPDEVDEAAQIINATICAAERDEPFPETLPAGVIGMFEEWGKTLEPGESIELNAGAGRRARFNQESRSRILSRMQEVYEDRVDLIGEVRAAHLRITEGGTFIVLLEGGNAVEGAFTAEQEALITDALHKHQSMRVRVAGVAEFEEGGHIRRILSVDHLEELLVGEQVYDQSVPPIWDEIDRIAAEVSDDEWDNVPTDLGRNLDHYLYGRKGEDVE